MSDIVVQHGLRNRQHFLFLPFLLALAGCNTVPTAPLVYWSRTVGGLDISTGSGANPGVNLSLGYQRHDLAFVPAGAVWKDEQGKEHFKIIKGVDDDKCDSQSGCKGSDVDGLSVFGGFEGRGIAGAGAPTASVNAVAANYFSTGIAAQKLARRVGNAVSARHVANCVEAVTAAAKLLASADQAAAIKEGMAACSKKED